MVKPTLGFAPRGQELRPHFCLSLGLGKCLARSIQDPLNMFLLKEDLAMETHIPEGSQQASQQTPFPARVSETWVWGCCVHTGGIRHSGVTAVRVQGRSIYIYI